MKENFKGYISLLGMTLAMLVYLSSCGKLDKIDGMEAVLDTTSSSRSSQCELIISGRVVNTKNLEPIAGALVCLLYTSPSPRDATLSRMPSSA